MSEKNPEDRHRNRGEDVDIVDRPRHLTEDDEPDVEGHVLKLGPEKPRHEPVEKPRH